MEVKSFNMNKFMRKLLRGKGMSEGWNSPLSAYPLNRVCRNATKRLFRRLAQAISMSEQGVPKRHYSALDILKGKI